MIMYSGTSYGGEQFHLLDTSANGCVSNGILDQPVRSFNNRGSRLEGYFYAGSSCNGTVLETVRRDSQSPDIGGLAYSFKVACVSCRSEG